MKKSLISFLAMALVLTMSFSVFAASRFSDVTNHWAKSSVERFSHEGIINGYSDGTFKPDDCITRAEFMALITRIFEPSALANLSAYRDVPTTAWYYEAISKGAAMGAIQGSGSQMRPEDNISRQEAILILDRLYHYETPKTDIAIDFADSDEIADWAYEAVLTFVDKGYIHGYEDRTLRPKAYITRAEVAKLLDNSIGMIITKAGTYDLKDIEGIVIVKAENVTLKNTENVDKIFVANENVKNSLTQDGVADKNIYTISEITPETVKQTSGRTSSSVPTLVIEMKTDDSTGTPKYTIKSNKDKITIAEGVKVTIVVDNADTAVKNTVFSGAKLDSFKTALETVIKNSLDAERVLNTIDEDYADVEELYDWGEKTIQALDLTEDERAVLHLLKESGAFTMYEVYTALGLTEEELEAKAVEIMQQFDFDQAMNLLKRL